jgi:hypothetical protein
VIERKVGPWRGDERAWRGQRLGQRTQRLSRRRDVGVQIDAWEGARGAIALIQGCGLRCFVDHDDRDVWPAADEFFRTIGASVGYHDDAGLMVLEIGQECEAALDDGFFVVSRDDDAEGVTFGFGAGGHGTEA